MKDARPWCCWTCVFCWGCLEPRDGGVCPSIGPVGAGRRGPRRPPMDRGPRTVVGLPPMGKPAVVARLEPLVWSQAKGWGRGLPPCPGIVPLR